MTLLLFITFPINAYDRHDNDVVDENRRLRPLKKMLSRMQKRERVVLGSYVVLVRQFSDVKGVLADYGLSALKVYRHALTGFAVDGIGESFVDELLDDPRVVHVAEDGLLDAEQESVAVKQPPVRVQSPVPWNLDLLDGRGGDFEYKYRYNGTGVHVYVLDSGIRATNFEFENRVVSDCFDEVGPCNTDTNGHGTHVAGIVGGRQFGVAKGVTLHDVRIRDSEDALRWAFLYAGFDYVIAERMRYPDRKLVINVSYSGTCLDITFAGSELRTNCIHSSFGDKQGVRMTWRIRLPKRCSMLVL